MEEINHTKIDVTSKFKEGVIEGTEGAFCGEISNIDRVWLENVEKEWRKQNRYSIPELFDIYPQAQETLEIKIKEEYARIRQNLSVMMAGIRESTKKDENTRWFLSELRRYFVWPYIEKAEKRIISYRRQLFLAKKQKDKGTAIPQSDIEAARAVPIESMIETKRPTGKGIYAHCPFHDDHTPSFVIYCDSNTFYCFGCQALGDVIAFVMRKEQIGFKEAIQLLIGK